MPLQTACGITVRRLTDQDRPLLDEMYSTFTPLGGARGLPPADGVQRRTWLDTLRQGLNFLAFVDDRLAGHLALLPIGDAAELTCFVHQDFRRRGLASALAQAAVEQARGSGYNRISVFIDTHNIGARRGLLKFGFRPVWEDLEEGEYVYLLK
jgi:RimJ/RimL family protein N-acetyltransferase